MDTAKRIQEIKVAVGFVGLRAVPADDHLKFVVSSKNPLTKLVDAIDRAVANHWDGSLARLEYSVKPDGSRLIEVWLG